MKFRVTIEPDEDGVFVAECPALPGCISQGKTRDEAMVNIRDAIQGYLESLKKHGEPIPAPITEAVVEGLPVCSGADAAKAFGKIGYTFDHQTGSHIILRHSSGRR